MSQCTPKISSRFSVFRDNIHQFITRTEFMNLLLWSSLTPVVFQLLTVLCNLMSQSMLKTVLGTGVQAIHYLIFSDYIS